MTQATLWKTHVDHYHRFCSLKTDPDLSPHKRGHELEALIRDVLISADWEVETNVRSPGEEHDLIIHRNLEYYLMECKWVKEPVQPYLLSILRDRITARIGMSGIFLSMSGFTVEATRDAADRLEQAMIMLFGPEDIENMMSHHVAFSDLLKEKFHAAITRRMILVDGKATSR